ncbi:G-protein coupled receptor 42-like [Suncus etruscus]|uniref:G-protein coupled receptor 42-like n=1 Tax=Suncus etruscus TaxID=109475 RepID=UPI00210F5D1F|nr:G-protein coupled receptor 42-like [Suncus etruscus]
MNISTDNFFIGIHWLHFSVYLFAFLVGLPLNVLALMVFVGKLRSRAVTVDMLLLNLTISDLILLLFLPFRMVEAAHGMLWPLPDMLCPLVGFLFFTTIYVTSLSLAAVSIERFLSVAYPVWYQSQPRLRQAALVSGACWLLSGSHCSVVYIVEFSGNNSHRNGTCYLEFQDNQLAILLPVRFEIAVVFFVIPLLITAYCYSHLLWLLSRGSSRRWRRRVAGLVVATLLNFIVFFGPFAMSHVMGFFQGHSPHWRSYALLLSTLNSCIDPLVYYFSSSQFQENVHRLLRYLAYKPGRHKNHVKEKTETVGQQRPPSDTENTRL